MKYILNRSNSIDHYAIVWYEFQRNGDRKLNHWMETATNISDWSLKSTKLEMK